MSDLKPLSFSPEIFERLEPELFLQRHLSQGLRPGGNRNFSDFRAIALHQGALGKETLGSCVLKTGGTSVVCGVVGGTTETKGAAGLYVNVEVLRSGRSSGPSQEEIILSRRCHDMVQAIGILNPELQNFDIEDVDDRWLVLNAHIIVLSRTGPLFDAIWNTLIGALKNTKIPDIKLDIDTNEVVCVGVESDRRLKFPSNIGYSSSFGVVDVADNNKTVLLSDLEGVTEESSVKSRINVVSDKSGILNAVSIDCRGSILSDNEGVGIDRNSIVQALKLARQRAESLETLTGP